METTVITRISQILEDLAKNLQCPICLHTVLEPHRTRCRHLFCSKCINAILCKKGATCPLCKASLTRRSVYPDRQIEIALRHYQTLVSAIKEDVGSDILLHSKIPGHTKESISPAKQFNKPRRRSHPSNLDKNVTEPSHTREERKTDTTTLSSYEDPHDYLACPSSSHDTRYGRPLSTEPQLNELNSNKRRSLRQANTTSKETAKSCATKDYSHRDEDNLSQIATNSANAAELPEGSLQKSSSDETNKRRRPKIRSIEVFSASESRSSQKNTSASFSENAEAHDKSMIADKNLSSDMLSSSEKNWSQVTIVGKEMRKSKRKLKTLNVSIESTSKAQELNKAVKESALGVAKEPQQRIVNTKRENDPNTVESHECSSRAYNRPLESNESLPNIESTYRREQCERKKRDEEIYPMDTSVLSGAENASAESLCMTLHEGTHIPIKKLNNDQMQEIIGLCGDMKNYQENQSSNKTSTPSKDQCHKTDAVSSPLVSPIQVLDNCVVEADKEKRSNTSRTQLESRLESASTPHRMKSLSLTETPTPRVSVNRDLLQNTPTTSDTERLSKKVTAIEQKSEVSSKNDRNSPLKMQQEQKENNMKTSSDSRGVIYKKMGRVVRRKRTLLQNPCKFLYLGFMKRGARTSAGVSNSILNSLKPYNPIDTHIEENTLDQPSSQKNSSRNTPETTLNDTVIVKTPIEASNSSNNSIRNTSARDTVKTSLVEKKLEESEETSASKRIISQDNDINRFNTADSNCEDMDVIFVSQNLSIGNRDEVHVNNNTVLESEQTVKDSSHAKHLPEANMKISNGKVTSSKKSSQLEYQSLTVENSHHNKSVENMCLSESRVRGVHSKALIRRSQQANTEDTEPDLVSNFCKKRKIIEDSDSSSDRVESHSGKTEPRFSKRKSVEIRSSKGAINNDMDSNNSSDSEILSDIKNLPIRRTYNRIVSWDNESTESGSTVLIEKIKASKTQLSDNTPTISSMSSDHQKKRRLSPDSNDALDVSQIVKNWRSDDFATGKYPKKSKIDVKDKLTLSTNLPLQPSGAALIKEPPASAWNLINSRRNLTEKNLDSSSIENRNNHDANVLVEEDDEFNSIIDRVREIRNSAQQQSSQESLFQDKDDEIIANIDTQAFLNGLIASAEKKGEILVERDTNETETKSKPPSNSIVEKLNTSKHDNLNRLTCCSTESGQNDYEDTDATIDFNEEENSRTRKISNSKTNFCDQEFSTKIQISDTTIASERLSESKKYEINRIESRHLTESNDNKLISQDIRMNYNTEQKESSCEQDSLVNVTQDQERLRQFEEDLFGKRKTETSPKTAIATGFATSKSLEDHKDSPQKDYNEPNVVGLPAKDSEHSSCEDDIVESTPERKTGNSFSTTRTSKTRQSAALSDLSPFSKHIGDQTTVGIPSSCKSTPGLSTPTRETRSMNPLHHSTPKPYRVTLKEQQNKPTRSNSDTNPYTKIHSSKPISIVPKQSNWNDTASKKNSNKATQKLCFVCSSLGLLQIECVKKLAVMLNAEYTAKFRPDISHLIVKADPATNAAEKTLKYLQGIAYGKWIVGFKWVEECLRQGKLVDEEGYEVVDSVSLEPSSRLSRLAKKPLFDGFAFLCIGPYVDISVEQYKDLLHAFGGIVVDTLESLAKLENLLKVIVIQGDTHDDEMIIDWYRKTRAVPIADDWVMDCISQYKLVSLHPFLHQLLPQDVLAVGYPNFLVEEVPDDYSNWDNTPTTLARADC